MVKIAQHSAVGELDGRILCRHWANIN